MSTLRSYTCSKCSGALIVDKDQEVLDCPFCGAKIGLAQFHEEDILGDGELALHRMEFSAAKDKYEYILKGDPSNFTALRGLIFAEGHVSSLAYIQRIEKLRKCNLPKMYDRIEYALLNCREEDKEYFVQLFNTISLYEEYSSLVSEDRTLSGNQENELGKIMDLHDQQDGLDSAFSKAAEFGGSILATAAKDPDENNSEAYTIIFVLALIVVGFGVSVHLFGAWGFLLPLAIVIFALLIRKFFDHQIESVKNPHREAVREIGGKISETAQKERDLEKQYSEQYSRLKELDPTKKK